jgi:hypothetical protein
MPADLITFPHLSVSSAMSFPKSAGEPSRDARNDRQRGSARGQMQKLSSVGKFRHDVSPSI